MAFRDYGSVLKCACLAAGLAWFAGCEGTETTNPKVTDNDPPGLHGRLVDGAGQPRAGVSVKAFQVEKSPLGKAAPKSAAASDTTVTDARGDYNFDSLQGGRYNLIGEYNGGGLVVLIPQIEYQGGASERNLGTDTLRLPGRITGSIRLGGKGREGVFCYLTGTSFLSLSDETGKFWFYGIPQGEYDLNLAYPGLQTAKDTGILVKAGETTVLQPRELGYDTAFPPPAPDSLRVAYDTLSGVVTLSWSRSQVADVDGYVVYRIDPLTSSPQRLNTALVRDTVFRDTLFRGSGDTASLVAAYQVKSQDRTTNRSTVFSPLVSVVCIPPGQVRTSLKMAMRTATGDIAVMRDTLRFIATYANPIRRHKRVAWKFSGAAAPLRERIADLPAAGADTLAIASLEPGGYGIEFEAEDVSGAIWRDRLGFDVIRDAPIAHAGREAVVPINTPTVLTGRGTDGFGRIVRYAWDFNADGIFDDSSATGGDVTRTYPAAGRQVHVLRVTDDDGNAAYDTLDFQAGGTFTSLMIGSDMEFRKAGGPYRIAGKVVIAEGAVVKVEPGARFQLESGSGFYVRGSLICAGTAKDSIYFSMAPASFGASDGGGIHFQGGFGSVVRDTTHVSGSILRFASFNHTPGIMIKNTLVTVEDCTFLGVVEGGFPGNDNDAAILLDNRALEADPLAQVGESWICRRNRFRQCSAILAYFSGWSPVQVHIYVHRNETDGGGIGVLASAQNRGMVSIEGNVIRTVAGMDESGAGFFLGSGGAANGVKFIFRNNLLIGPGLDPLNADFSSGYAGIFVQDETPADLFNNEFRGCPIVMFDQGFIGRFHHNVVDGGWFGFNARSGAFKADSNAFGPGVKVGRMIPLGTLDFRNNYWSTTDPVAIQAKVIGNTGGPDPEVAPVKPFLFARPPGVGRQDP